MFTAGRAQTPRPARVVHSCSIYSNGPTTKVNPNINSITNPLCRYIFINYYPLSLSLFLRSVRTGQNNPKIEHCPLLLYCYVFYETFSATPGSPGHQFQYYIFPALLDLLWRLPEQSPLGTLNLCAMTEPLSSPLCVVYPRRSFHISRSLPVRTTAV